MGEAQRIQDYSMGIQLTDARDELNLAEFPLCVLGHRALAEQKTLQFEDRIWDQQRGEHVTRRLTVTGSDAYGLPTALDDEVLLGLIQLSKWQGFAERKVAFTRYQLLQILNWRQESKNYERLETSLNRWTGVTLFYSNAWWNRDRQCWVDEKFHVLDNVRLYHRGRSRAPAALADDDSHQRSTFVWNEVLFDSFRAGNLKCLDFEFYRDLENATAKRLYRFLDKRFYRRKSCQFNLKELAWEHIGLARNYDVAGLKRRLRPGIEELERKQFLRPLPESVRFRKVCAGEWTVCFDRDSATGSSVAQGSAVTGRRRLVEELTARGVAAEAARRIAGTFEVDRIERQIEILDWLLENKDPRVSRNPPGFLIRSIEGDFASPPGFVSRQERLRREQEAMDKKNGAKQHRRRQRRDRQSREHERQAEIQSFWESLAPEEAAAAAAEALAQASPLQREWIRQGGSIGKAARDAVLESYARERITRRN
jgi:hypothetical protein